jgi:heptosyltransferase I
MTEANTIPIRQDARILLVRLSAIGDVIFASPLIAALRRACPHGHLAWLVQPECAPLLEHHPDLDETIVCPMRHWRNLWGQGHLIELAGGIRTLSATLRERRFDIALDLQGLLKSGVLTRLSDAKMRIGLGSREGNRRFMTRVVPRGGDPDRIGSEYLFLAETLGLPVDRFEMAVHYAPADAAFAAETIERERLDDGYAVLCPFTTRPQKHWVESRWAELAAGLTERLGLAPVVLGGPSDVEAAVRICDASRVPILDLAGQTSLTEAAALIERAELCVAVDTGLGHMGIALERPSVLIFGSTCPYRDTTKANARVIYHDLSCSPCKRRPTCDGQFQCMSGISTAEVLQTARQVIGTPP